MTDEGPTAERVLIIDDDPDVGRLLQLQVEKTGREVRLTADPEEFFTLHREWNPAFVVVDLVMPKMDGLDVLTHLARDNCTAAVIISSGLGSRVMDAARRFADANGLEIAGILGKPHTKAEVQKAFERRTDHPFAEIPAGIDTDDWPPAAFQVDFRAAVMSDEMSVVYQPKVSCDNGAVVGYEALARWTHPERGVIGPNEFVPLSERFGLVALLTDRIMRDGLEWFGARPRPAGMRLAINISAVEFEDDDLDQRYVRACDEAAVSPEEVVLELTETSAMEDPVRSLRLLTKLRLAGFHISLDDFGTGYSSMLQLARLPFSELKVDQSFVADCATSQESRIVVSSIIDLGHALGMQLTAEGVEDEAALTLLRELGCDFAQGYHIARPMPPDELASWATDVSI